ncbi:MAG: MBL fold metallo-hydrolase [Nanoarchaeota archaeon]
MEVCALASGSSGNCFYIGNGSGGILVDVGISCKQVCERLCDFGIDPRSVGGIFLTHEHVDHIRGADVFARSFGIPIFAPRGVLKDRFVCSDVELLNVLSGAVKVNGLSVESFSKSHKAVEPVSFSVCEGRKRVSVITDVGMACKNVVDAVKKSDFLFLESNHDLKMLEEGRYPVFLKRWISSDNGHLSNEDAAECVLKYGSEKLKSVVLSHLSENNNSVDVALTTWAKKFYGKKDAPEIFVSTRELGEMFGV